MLDTGAIKGGIKVSSQRLPSKELPKADTTAAGDREAVGARTP